MERCLILEGYGDMIFPISRYIQEKMVRKHKILTFIILNRNIAGAYVEAQSQKRDKAGTTYYCCRGTYKTGSHPQ